MKTKESIEITQLKSLGIDEQFFPDNLTNEEAALLYKKLKSPMTTFNPCLIINKTWQLYILARQKLPDSIDLTAEKDNRATPPLHYLAWSDNFEELLKSFETHPEHFSAVNDYGRNVLHYLAFSGNADGLATFKDHPLFTAVDKHGWTVFHCLARSGNADGLATFKDHPLFTAVDKNGWTVFHCLARSGNADGLATFKDHSLFTAVDKNGFSIAHYAALSKNPKALAIAWNFMGEDNQKKFYTKLKMIDSSHLKIIMFEIVESALKNNYRLPFSDNVQPQSSLSLTDEQKAIISKLHQRNQAMDDTVISFKVFLLGLVQDKNKNPIAKIARDVLFEIFKRMLPESIVDNNKIIAVFNKIFNKMQPAERIKQQRLLREKASTVIIAEINKLTNFSLNKMLNPTITQEKITALNKLKNLVNHTNNPLTLDMMKEWYVAYGPIINRERTPLRKFFQPEHITSTRMLVTNICKAFGFNEKEVTENFVAERRVTTPHY